MPDQLSTGRAAALYIGALLGPSLLLLPGLAASAAGPASIIAWVALLLLSGLFARLFTVLGTRIRGRGGVAAYAAAGLGARTGRAAAWCFLSGVVFGAPVVCLVGGAYVAALFGGGHIATVTIAAALLVAVVALTLTGARATSTVQLALVAVLIVLVVIAVAGTTGGLRARNWTPFAPHGAGAIGSAAALLMLSFVGWEAIAPMTGRLRDPGRQLPRVIGIAFAVTTAVYLSLATATIGVLGTGARSAVPLADLLHAAIGTAGRPVAAVAAVALTLAATNAYLSGAAELAGDLRGRSGGHGLQLAIAATGVVLLGASAAGWVGTARLVLLPTTLFLTVYLLCTAAAVRILHGRDRTGAVIACAAVAVVLAFMGATLAVAVVVVVMALGRPRRPAGGSEPATEATEAPELVRIPSSGC